MHLREKIVTSAFVCICSLCSLPSLAAAAHPATRASDEEAPPQALTTWHLSDAKVLSAGEALESPEGWVISGYTLELQADSALPRERFQHGVFLVKLHLFSPRRDMPGQRKGIWYLRGDWRFTDSAADPEALSTRHNPFAISGLITSELPFNPARQSGELRASVAHKMLLREPMGRSRDGEFQGNERFEGTLLLPLPLPSVNPNEYGGPQ